MSGPSPPPRRRLSDSRHLRALAHPLRLAVLQYLMAVGPRTASECAAEVGSTASNVSWHLRHLAQYGLVEPAETTDQRERPWRAAQVGMEFGAISTDPVAMAEQDALIAGGLAEEGRLTQRFLDHRDTLDPRWLSVARLDSLVLRATPEEVGELAEQIVSILRPFLATVRQDPPQDAELSYVGLRLLPRLDSTGQTQ